MTLSWRAALDESPASTIYGVFILFYYCMLWQRLRRKTAGWQPDIWTTVSGWLWSVYLLGLAAAAIWLVF
jgi:hypothetical protein